MELSRRRETPSGYAIVRDIYGRGEREVCGVSPEDPVRSNSVLKQPGPGILQPQSLSLCQYMTRVEIDKLNPYVCATCIRIAHFSSSS